MASLVASSRQDSTRDKEMRIWLTSESFSRRVSSARKSPSLSLNPREAIYMQVISKHVGQGRVNLTSPKYWRKSDFWLHLASSCVSRDTFKGSFLSF